MYVLHSVELLGRTWASSRLSVVLFCSACDRVMRTCLRSRGLFLLDHLNLLAPMFQQACITYWENHPPARELICSWWQSPDSVQIFIDRLKLGGVGWGGVRVILWGQQKEFFPRGGSQTFLEDPEISWGSRSWRWSEVLRSERAVCPSPSGRHLCLERAGFLWERSPSRAPQFPVPVSLISPGGWTHAPGGGDTQDSGLGAPIASWWPCPMVSGDFPAALGSRGLAGEGGHGTWSPGAMGDLGDGKPLTQLSQVFASESLAADSSCRDSASLQLRVLTTAVLLQLSLGSSAE